MLNFRPSSNVGVSGGFVILWRHHVEKPTKIVNRKERARLALDSLREMIPRPETELEFTDPYELIVAVILSAQCTDARVNKVTPALFEAYPTVEALAEATPEEVFTFIRSCSYPNNKAKHLVGMANRVVEDFGGRIPQAMEDLVKLPGVGRKSAQVVMSVAYDLAALPVDTHVFRVANRIGITRNAGTPEKVERQLKALLEPETWGEAHHLLILHGRYTCTARAPACYRCKVAPYCKYFEQLQRLPPDINPPGALLGKYYCKTGNHFFDQPDLRVDRYGTDQIACPACSSMNVYLAKTGKTTKRVKDYRIG